MSDDPAHDDHPGPLEDPGFAPADRSDGRERGHWESRWPKSAQQRILIETSYVFLVLLVLAISTLAIWTGAPQSALGVGGVQYRVFSDYAYALFGGMLGGTIFDLKWLYHSVAKGTWNSDRLLWRVFTPWISGGVGFALYCLASSGLVPLVDPDQLESGAAIIGISFVVGYFSDNAVAALANIANSLFGHEGPQAYPGGELQS